MTSVRTSLGEVAYREAGEGPTVLLLHGFPTSSYLWRDLIPLLAARSRVIAPDLLGYGESDKPEVATIRDQAVAMSELLDGLGAEDVAVVGHDIGGGIAQLLALSRDLRALVLIDSIAFDAWPIEGVRMLQEVPDEPVDEEFVRGVVGVSLDLGMAHPERLSAEDREELVRPWLVDPAALVRAARGIDGIGLADAPLETLDTRTLVVWGEEDPYLSPGLADRLGELMPGASVALLPGCSHFVTEDAPEAVLPLIVEYLRVHHLRETHGHETGPVPLDLGVSFERPAPSMPEGFDDLA